MTGGVDWDVLVSPLASEISPVHALVFSVFIAGTVLGMMNIITGVFVDSALKNTRVSQDIDLVNDIRGLFMSIDRKGTGEITWEQFERQRTNPAMDQYFRAVDLDGSEARGLFKLLELDE